jgi:hypothetical protein
MASFRVSQLKQKIGSDINADNIMMNILEVFTEAELVPDVGNYYTFIYICKTPEITYDQFPLVAVTNVERWGFRGINFHWGDYRNYTWEEIAGKLHLVYNDEIEYLRSLRYAKMITK